MKVEPTRIPGLMVLRPARHGDERGFFSEVFNPQTLSALGIEIDLPGENHSLSQHAGTLRGLHYQAPPNAQAKLVRCARGALYDVVVDIRMGAPTYGTWYGIELSFENGTQLYIPKGLAHGFCTLVDDTEINYRLSDVYDPASEGAIIWDDPELGIVWPLPTNAPILSDKDANAPKFKELDSPFVWNGGEQQTAVPASNATALGSSVSIYSIKLSLGGLLDHIVEKRESLNQHLPNSALGTQEKAASLALLDFIEEHVTDLDQQIDTLISSGEASLPKEQRMLIDKIGEELRKWMLEQSPEMVDVAMRLGPGTMFLAVLSMAGASMNWATPIVLAMCGGKKIVDLVKALK